ncbi:MAG: hypothetical protein M3539_13610 [Acidobacteriota bacterium]|nr:hypothetical protein [Acidobacteriota bacterium]
MNFEIVSEITQIQPIAINRQIRDVARLRKMYGKGRWRKLKGVAHVRLRSGRIRLAELHWYEAHGKGRKEMKRKLYLD